MHHKKKKISLRLLNKTNLAVAVKCPHTAFFSDRPCITTGWCERGGAPWLARDKCSRAASCCPAGEFQGCSALWWGEPSRVLGTQRLLGCCFWPIFLGNADALLKTYTLVLGLWWEEMKFFAKHFWQWRVRREGVWSGSGSNRSAVVCFTASFILSFLPSPVI